MPKQTSAISRSVYGRLPDGQEVVNFSLTNAAGICVSISDYGARLVSIQIPDGGGNRVEIILGYEDLNGYLQDPYCFGSVIGRYANRIARGRFDLEGQTYQLATNNPPNHLHGGVRSFDKVLWQGSVIENGKRLQMQRTSPDGEEGYPGNLETTLIYTLDDENRLTIDMTAVTDKTTIVSLSLHPYFNLAGPGGGSTLDHELQLHADAFLPLDENVIPTGEIRPVEGTPMDFRERRRIGDRIEASDEQLRIGAGYDHCWVLRGPENVLKPAAMLTEPTSGRSIEISCTQPGIQFYSGNHLEDSPPNTSRPIGYRKGLPLEPEAFPDSPNKSHFPTTVLRPGEEYRQRIVYRFGGFE